jgi:hypothetical protein
MSQNTVNAISSAEIKVVDTRIPVITPLLALLRSRKVIISIVSVLVSLAVTHAPELAPVREYLFVLIGTVALALIGGISWEDASAAAKEELPRLSEEPYVEVIEFKDILFLEGREQVRATLEKYLPPNLQSAAGELAEQIISDLSERVDKVIKDTL